MRIGDPTQIPYAPPNLRRPTVEPPASPPDAPVSGASGSFGSQITGAIENVNQLQNTANGLVEQVAAGNTDDTHKAMVAMERAMLTFDFTLQVRNKALEAYQEIMRTQV